MRAKTFEINGHKKFVGRLDLYRWFRKRITASRVDNRGATGSKNFNRFMGWAVPPAAGYDQRR